MNEERNLTTKGLGRQSRNQRRFGTGELTAKVAKNAKEEVGISRAKTQRAPGNEKPEKTRSSKSETNSKQEMQKNTMFQTGRIKFSVLDFRYLRFI
jgi:hypothetical protein